MTKIIKDSPAATQTDARESHDSELAKTDDSHQQHQNKQQGTEQCNVKPDLAKEVGGPKGLEPTRYGDWESKGRCYDF